MYVCLLRSFLFSAIGMKKDTALARRNDEVLPLMAITTIGH